MKLMMKKLMQLSYNMIFVAPSNPASSSEVKPRRSLTIVCRTPAQAAILSNDENDRL